MPVVKATTQRPPLPPFTHETAIEKVLLAEDSWNSYDPEKVLAYTVDSRWRNRSEFVNGRQEIVAFLTRKWTKELDYRLIKELWAHDGNRIAVRFAYEWHDDSRNLNDITVFLSNRCAPPSARLPNPAPPVSPNSVPAWSQNSTSP
jgi:nuclear transport factor 2 (NTF2) superfamily protein